jgi:plastocyanin
MRLALRFLVVPVMIGASLIGVSLAEPGEARAANTEVMIHDNDGPTPNQGLDVRTGQWGFMPQLVAVTKGDQVTITSPQGNARPHNVVSISRAGTSAEPVLESATKFTSGLAMDTWIRPGNSWVLDTSAVDPGYYSYYCSLHPWMVGSITILPPAQ